MAEDTVQINLRVPRKLRDRIDERAAKAGRSRNSWLEAAISWALEQPTKTATKRTVEEI